MQQAGALCNRIITTLRDKKIQDGHRYFLKNNILMRYVTDNKQTFETAFMPISLNAHLLRQDHDELGHVSSRTPMFLRLYYWKGQKLAVYKNVKQYRPCQQRNKQGVKYASLHLSDPKAPMQFISMDLTGKFHS